ncbi:MAG: hypothetical protein HY848_17750 [Betaproteobacteria bacterium]|nr:hypothetical protein [Betaproteobacteria bacterium]
MNGDVSEQQGHAILVQADTAEECAEAILWPISGEAAYMIGGMPTLSGGR